MNNTVHPNILIKSVFLKSPYSKNAKLYIKSAVTPVAKERIINNNMISVNILVSPRFF